MIEKIKGSIKNIDEKLNKIYFFVQDTRGNAKASIRYIYEMALTLNPTSGVDLVVDRPSSFTAAPNSKMQFTDLRGAYTSESTISDKISNVQVKERNLEQYRASREKAPDPFNESELHSIRDFEQRQSQQDQLRERRRAEMAVQNQDFFERMKRRVITDGAVDLNQGKLGY